MVTIKEYAVYIVGILRTQILKDENKSSRNNNNRPSWAVNKQSIHFLICDSWFWCASCIRLDASTVTCCNCNKVQSMPIEGDQVHKNNYDFVLDNTEILFWFVECDDKNKYKKKRRTELHEYRWIRGSSFNNCKNSCAL